MRIRGICILLLCLPFLMFLASCAQAGLPAAIMVHISYDSPKTISPDHGTAGSADVSHYMIIVIPSEGSTRALVFPTGSGSFRIGGLRMGLSYVIEAEALVRDPDGNGYITLASGSSGPLLFSGGDTDVDIAIDKPAEGKSGAVSADIILPFGLRTPGTDLSASWAISDFSGAVLHQSGPISANVGPEGQARVELVPAGLLEWGNYIVSVEISGFDSAGNAVTVSGAEAMRLLPGLPAYGIIHMESSDPAGFTVSVSNGLGGDIPIEPEDGSYILSSSSGTIRISGIGSMHSVRWFIDGKDASGSFAEDPDDPSSFLFSGLPSGTHTVSAIIYDEMTTHSTGHIAFTAVVPQSPSIEEASE